MRWVPVASRLGAQLVAMACGLFFPALATGQVRGAFDRTLEIPATAELVELDVAAGAGDITVKTGPDRIVQVHGAIRGPSGAGERVRQIEANPPIEQEGRVIRIGHFEDRDLWRNVRIRYELVVPAGTALTSRTGSGDQRIADLHGPVVARTGSGTIEIGRIGARVEARTGSGAIAVEGAAGGLEAQTGSGSIDARGVAGPIAARTGSGSIDLEQTSPGEIAVRSGSGEVHIDGARGPLTIRTGSGDVEIAGAMGGDWEIHAASGDVTVDLPEDAAFDLDARSSSGKLETAHPVTIEGALRKNRLQGAVRGGGPRLSVRTSSGTIHIR